MDGKKRYIAKEGFIARNIGGENVLVPTGDCAQEFNGMVQLDEVGLAIWNAVLSPKTIDELVCVVNETFEVPDGTDVASDILEFLENGIQNGIIFIV